MSRVAVTGGAGFLGSHIVNKQLSKGNEVLIVDNFSSGSEENLKDLGVEGKCKVITGDLRNYDVAKKSLKDIDTVYHFAAEVGSVDYLHGSAWRELDALQANIVIDANVFRACRENNVGCVVYASSVSVYPFEKQLGSGAVFKEEDASEHVSPEGGYGWSKYLGEIQMDMMAESVAVGNARIFHAYGENIYIKPDRSQVIASLMRKAMNYPREDFVVWGNGEQRRCFVFIDDTLDALDLLENYVKSKKKALAVNLGSENEVSIRELAEMIVKISGKEIPMKFDASKPTGMISRKPDLTRIRRELGWTPTTKLQDGLTRTYKWFLARSERSSDLP